VGIENEGDKATGKDVTSDEKGGVSVVGGARWGKRQQGALVAKRGSRIRKVTLSDKKRNGLASGGP